MKANAVVLASRPAPLFLSPRGRAIPRRLRITLWQTPSWIKKIVKLRKRSGTGRKLRDSGGIHRLAASKSARGCWRLGLS